jgi:hypothetical protein
MGEYVLVHQVFGHPALQDRGNFPGRAFLQFQHRFFREKRHVRRNDGILQSQQRVVRRRVRIDQHVQPYPTDAVIL